MLKGIKEVLTDIFDLFYKVIYGYARWILAAVIVIIYAQIFCRNMLRTNIHWSQEVALLLIVWMAFLDIAVGAEKNLHIGMELLHDKLPAKIRSVMDMLSRIITSLVGAFFTVYGVRMMLSVVDSRLPVAKRPSSLVYIMIPVSNIATIYFTVLDIMDLKEHKETGDASKFNREEGEKE